MLNLGLIGDIHILEPFTTRAHEHPEVHITGKSSVGTHPLPGSFRLSAPEFNRIELIERSDVLMINRFSLLPFQMLCDMVKKTKHIFAASYPKLTVEECSQLAKLAQEAQTIIQITNPFYYFPAMQWLNKNIKKPVFINVNYFRNEMPGPDTLFQLLLMLKSVTSSIPKKTSAATFQNKPGNSIFNNFQLEYNDGTKVSVSYGKTDSPETFNIKTFASDQFGRFDFLNKEFFINKSPLDLSPLENENETDSFLNAIIQKKQSSTSLEDYLSVIQSVQAIQAKLDRYSTL